MKKYNFFKTKEDRKNFYLSREWRKLRELALSRDNYECQDCKKEGKVTTRQDMVLEVHHIVELEKEPKLALELNNLKTLCKLCHNKAHGRVFTGGKKEKKDKWQDEKW